MATVTSRSDERWMTALASSGAERDRALADLRAAVLRGLRAAVDPSGRLTDADLEDFAQDGVLAVLRALPSYRGEGRFVSWALKIAVREALSQLRRHHWRDVSLDRARSDGESLPLPHIPDDDADDPEQLAVQRLIGERLYRSIGDDLTDRQRQALTAVHLQGMPLAEVARRMGTNRNALYKLLHDARRRLRCSLLAAGISSEEILDAFGD